MTLDKQKLEAAIAEETKWTDALTGAGYEHHLTVLSALRFTLAAMDKPSDEVIQAGITSYNENGNFALVSHFKAMIAALVAQVEGE